MRVSEIVPIGEIRPYENNPRRNDGAVDAVAASIKNFDFNQPIVVDKNGVIIVGHTRYKAAQKLGMTEVPIIRADDLTEEQAKAYRLADNKTAELAEWDFAKLDEELAELDFDMSEFGFDADSIDFDSEVAAKTESEYEEKEEQLVVCPNCGLSFSPILK